ncbi:unnamed protein product [Strongylus vulgaris]|uniref:Uncharacterized protein n=1 Tax=Strongylus vulgaris TaxID=40348 RepID=A0A3P7L9P0_STRVU|nr:unnamed protein product [Strongylus vulgaris]
MDDISGFIRLLLGNAAATQAVNNSTVPISQTTASTDVKNQAGTNRESPAKPPGEQMSYDVFTSGLNG